MAFIRGSELLLLNKAEEKMNKGESLTPEEEAVVTAHPQWLKKNMVRRCGCGCGEPLEPRVDGERHRIEGKGEVNSDCYYREFGNALEALPGLPEKDGFVFLAGVPRRMPRGCHFDDDEQF